MNIQRKYRRAGQEMHHVPQIDHELAESLRVLAELEARLPAIRTQAAQVRVVYDSGRQKVAYLVIHTVHMYTHLPMTYLY